MFNLQSFPTGSIRRYRGNFSCFAKAKVEAVTVRCSEVLLWHSLQSWRVINTSTGVVFKPVTGGSDCVPGDNVNDDGQHHLSWNLQ